MIHFPMEVEILKEISQVACVEINSGTDVNW
jgi:hypothetical protein